MNAPMPFIRSLAVTREVFGKPDTRNPIAHFCYGCDGERPFERAYCVSCGEETDAYQMDADTDFSTLERYLSDPAYAARMDAERDANRATANAFFDTIRDRALAARDARENAA